MKISQYLVKLLTKVGGLLFGPPCMFTDNLISFCVCMYFSMGHVQYVVSALTFVRRHPPISYPTEAHIPWP